MPSYISREERRPGVHVANNARSGCLVTTKRYAPSIPVGYEVALEHAHRVLDADIMIANSEVGIWQPLHKLYRYNGRAGGGISRVNVASHDDRNRGSIIRDIMILLHQVASHLLPCDYCVQISDATQRPIEKSNAPS